jgi:autotransporter-associated beta strand protein
VIGDLVIVANALVLFENDDITQGAAWLTTATTTLNAGSHDVVLSDPHNVLGSLNIVAANITLVEADQTLLNSIAWSGALDISTRQDLRVAGVISGNGTANLTAQGAITFDTGGALDASALGAQVTLTADSDGVGGGGITLADGSVISAGSGSIALLATGDITLGRLITGNGTSAAVRVVSSAGSVRDGGDSGGADITAVAPGALVTIQAAAGVGTASNALDLEVRHLAVTTTDSDQFLAEQDGLESLQLRAGLGSITLAAGGSILDGDAELDVQAQNLVLRALAVGSVISPLETQVATLTAQLSGGGLELVEHDGLTVLSATALASSGNIGLKSLSGDLQLVSLQASGLVTLQTPAGAVLRGGELPLTITAAQLEIAANSGAGTLLRPLRTAVAALEVDGGSGGVFVQNTGDLVIGGIASSRLGLSGLAAHGAHLVVSTQGSLTTTESIRTTHSGTVLLGASLDLLLGSTISTDFGDIAFAAARDLVASSAVDIVTASGSVRLIPDNDNIAGGSMRFAGRVDAGIGAVIIQTTDAASLLTGSIENAAAVIKLGPGTLTIDTSSVNTYGGTTEIRGGTLRVDGVIGAITSAQTVSISGGAVLSGSGDVNAAIFSDSTGSLIRSSGNLRLGDGTADGIRVAGQLLISTGHQVVLRDADLSQLGVLTVIATGARLIANNGVEVSGGDMVSGSGAVAGNEIEKRRSSDEHLRAS